MELHALVALGMRAGHGGVTNAGRRTSLQALYVCVCVCVQERQTYRADRATCSARQPERVREHHKEKKKPPREENGR